MRYAQKNDSLKNQWHDGTHTHAARLHGKSSTSQASNPTVSVGTYPHNPDIDLVE
jgi:hypothetical protein